MNETAGKQILIVEDHAGEAQVLAEALRYYGCVVVYARNTDEAIAILDKQDFNALLVDMQMPPGRDGTYVIRAYREKGGKGKVIALSGSYYEREALAAGADYFIFKPIQLQDLYSKLGIDPSRRK